MSGLTILGIDIAKDKFDIVLFKDGQVLARGQFPNNPSGFKAFRTWLKKKAAKMVWTCIEATGRYGDKLALNLHETGQQVSVVNPAKIKKYAESKLRRNKTDQLDAALIADYCETQ